MRIYFLSGSLLPSMEASSVNVMRTCDALARIGNEVTLFARRNGTDDVAAVSRRYGVSADVRLLLLGDSAPYRELNGLKRWDGYSRNIRYPLAVRRALHRLPPPDLIYGRHLYTMALAALALPAVPMAYELHQVRSNRVGRWVERWLFQRPAFLGATAVSQALIADYRHLHADLAGLDLFRARNGADEPRDGLQPSPLGGRSGARRIGYIGSLFPGKGMETVAALAARLPELDFHVVGGSAADLANWHARTAGLRNLIFHGFVDNAQVEAYLAAMDVLLAPPRLVTLSVTGRDMGRWMSPLKIFQYMAAGKPIIASDIPVVREILRDRVTALLVPAEDMDAWVVALRTLEDPVLARRLAAAAQAELVQQFTWTAKAKAVTEYLCQRLRLLPQ